MSTIVRVMGCDIFWKWVTKICLVGRISSEFSFRTTCVFFERMTKLLCNNTHTHTDIYIYIYISMYLIYMHSVSNNWKMTCYICVQLQSTWIFDVNYFRILWTPDNLSGSKYTGPCSWLLRYSYYLKSHRRKLNNSLYMHYDSLNIIVNSQICVLYIIKRKYWRMKDDE